MGRPFSIDMMFLTSSELHASDIHVRHMKTQMVVPK